MDKVEINDVERYIYENYLLKVLKEGRLHWNQPSVPNTLKKMAKEINEYVKQRTKTS